MPASPPSLLMSQGLIFVVDSNDRERITEAQEELQKMVRPGLWLCGHVHITCPPVTRGRVTRGHPPSLRQQAGPAQRHDRLRTDGQAGAPEPQEQEGEHGSHPHQTNSSSFSGTSRPPARCRVTACTRASTGSQQSYPSPRALGLALPSPRALGLAL